MKHLKKELPLDQEKLDTMDKMANFICSRDLEIPAIMFIESTTPLHRLGSHMLVFFQPFLNIVMNDHKITLFRDALEDKRYIEYLLKKIEADDKN